MGSHPSCIVPLAESAAAGDGLVGGKAARLGSLIQAGFRVPRGFCITTRAYEQFIAEAGLSKHLAMELGRKPLDAMRWEELWDAALRIRSAFLRVDIPEAIAAQIRRALADHIGDGAVAVRSSAPGEDSQQLSFAGLHESTVGVKGAGPRTSADLGAYGAAGFGAPSIRGGRGSRQRCRCQASGHDCAHRAPDMRPG